MEIFFADVAHAASETPTISGVIAKLTIHILNPVIALMFAVALIVFMWGLFEFLKDAGNSDSREKGTQHILWGSIGMAIMVSVYGIIRFVDTTVYDLSRGVF